MGIDSETLLHNVLLIIVIIWSWQIGTHLETPYPAQLVDAYAIPLTRLLLLGLVLLATLWSPTLGIFVAMSYVCLGADVIFFGQP